MDVRKDTSVKDLGSAELPFGIYSQKELCNIATLQRIERIAHSRIIPGIQGRAGLMDGWVGRMPALVSGVLRSPKYSWFCPTPWLRHAGMLL